ncbi:hypothetical protein WJX79_009216 [Trebouxia sp. C0005]
MDEYGVSSDAIPNLRHLATQVLPGANVEEVTYREANEHMTKALPVLRVLDVVELMDERLALDTPLAGVSPSCNVSADADLATEIAPGHQRSFHLQH